MKSIYLILVLILFCPRIYSQEYHSNYYKAFDSIVGIESTNLINGVRFKNQDRTTKETDHRFLQTQAFVKGSITYDSQPYYNLHIKYDIYQDNLVLKLPEDKKYFDLKIDTDKVSEFSIANQKFVNFNNNTAFLALGFDGFLEPIYKGNTIQLFVKYHKKRREYIKQKKSYSSFKADNTYLFYLKGKFYEFQSKNKLKKTFSKQADSINVFYKDNSVLLKRNPNEFMKQLFKLIDSKN